MNGRSRVFGWTMFATVIAAGTAQGSSISITSGVSDIRALGATTHTTYYGFGSGCYEFATFTAADFASAVAAPAASVLNTPLPGSWNNPGNLGTGSPWTGPNSGSMNSNNARWIHNSADSLNGGGNNEGVSVLYAMPFTPTSSVVDITLDFVTDNGLGSTNGANNIPGHAGFQNDGLFLNGATLGYSSPGGPGAPAQFGTISQLAFSGLSVNANVVNYLYFYQFNWGGYGGSAFNFNIEMVPLPPAGWAGLASLVGVMGIGLARRRRMRIG